MKSQDLAPHGPFTISIEFNLTDGETIAKASFDLSPGQVPDAAVIAKAAEAVIAQVQDQVGDQYRWQTRHEFVQELMAARTGGLKFAVPGLDKFEAEWAA